MATIRRPLQQHLEILSHHSGPLNFLAQISNNFFLLADHQLQFKISTTATTPTTLFNLRGSKAQICREIIPGLSAVMQSRVEADRAGFIRRRAILRRIITDDSQNATLGGQMVTAVKMVAEMTAEATVEMADVMIIDRKTLTDPLLPHKATSHLGWTSPLV